MFHLLISYIAINHVACNTNQCCGGIFFYSSATIRRQCPGSEVRPLAASYFLCISCHFGPCITNHAHAGEEQRHFCLIVIHENGGSNSAQDNTFALVNSRDKNQEQRAESNSSFVFDFANITCFCRLRRISEEETATSSGRQVRRRGKNKANLLLRYRSAPSASDWPSR